MSQDPILFYDPKKPYGQFSNFWGTKFDRTFKLTIDGVDWPSTEHYFQAMKFNGDGAKDREYFELVRAAKTPGIAKFLASQRPKRGCFNWQNALIPTVTEYLDAGVRLRADWEEVKDDVMLTALTHKFAQNPVLGDLLRATGVSSLVEHTSRDSYWGDGGDGSGLNRLGELLMVVRAKLIDTQQLEGDEDGWCEYEIVD